MTVFELEEDERIERVLDADSPSRALYDIGEETAYGLGGAVEQGVPIRKPSEIDEQANCYEQALLNYTIAEEAGLEPRFLETVTRSPEMVHGFVEVQDGDDRYIVDPFQGMYGTIESYSDTDVVIDPEDDHKERLEINGIKELSEQQIEHRVASYRNDPETMFNDGQRLFEFSIDDFKVYDKLKYNKQTQSLERTISFSDKEIPGYMNHNILIEQSIDDPEERSVSFADIEGGIWRNFDEGDVIARFDEEGTYEIADLSSKLHQQIATVSKYEEQKPADGRIEDEATLRAFWNEFEDAHGQFRYGATVMNRHITERFMNVYEATGDNFLNWLDWFHFAATENEPYDVDDDRITSYIENRHEKILDAVQDRTAGIMEQASSLFATYQSDQSYTIADQRISSAYDGLKDTIEADIDTVRPLLFVDEDARKQLQALVDDPDLQQELVKLPEDDLAYHSFFNDAEARWSFDRDAGVLRREETLGAPDFNIYMNQIELEYDLDPAGRIQEKQVRFTVSTEQSNEAYTVFEQSFDDLEDISFDDVVAAFENREDAIRARGQLDVPEPVQDTNLIETKWRSIALYSSPMKEENVVFPDDELENVFDIAWKEFETASEYTYPSQTEQDRVEESLEVLEEIGALDDGESYQIAERNIVTRGVQQGDRYAIRERIDALDETTTKEALVWGFYNAMTAMDTDTIDERLMMTQEGLAEFAPDPEELDRFAAQEGYAQIKEMNQVVESVGYSWEEKADIIHDRKNTLSHLPEAIANQIVTSFATRMKTRDRYQAYESETDDNLIAALEDEITDDVDEFDRQDLIEV